VGRGEPEPGGGGRSRRREVAAVGEGPRGGTWRVRVSGGSRGPWTIEKGECPRVGGGGLGFRGAPEVPGP
jgi:hypothetical protein